VYRFSVGKCERRSLGRPKCKWEDNIKADLKEIAVDDVSCIYLAQDRDIELAFVNTVTNMSGLKSISFTKRTLCSGHRSFVSCACSSVVTCSTRVATE
jgi:hypothetical protein